MAHLCVLAHLSTHLYTLNTPHQVVYGDTHHPVDSVLSQRAFGHDHQVGLDAPLLQIVTAVASVPRLHFKLPVETLHGGLGDVDTPEEGGGARRSGVRV